MLKAVVILKTIDEKGERHTILIEGEARVLAGDESQLGVLHVGGQLGLFKRWSADVEINLEKKKD